MTIGYVFLFIDNGIGDTSGPLQDIQSLMLQVPQDVHKHPVLSQFVPFSSVNIHYLHGTLCTVTGWQTKESAQVGVREVEWPAEEGGEGALGHADLVPVKDLVPQLGTEGQLVLFLVSETIWVCYLDNVSSLIWSCKAF